MKTPELQSIQPIQLILCLLLIQRLFPADGQAQRPGVATEKSFPATLALGNIYPAARLLADHHWHRLCAASLLPEHHRGALDHLHSLGRNREALLC